MTTPAHNQTLLDMRRARVAQLKLRGMTTREIALALAQGDAHGNGRIVNPSTGQPFSHTQIVADLKVLQAEWKEQRLQDTDTHAERELAEINEIKRAAWATSDPELALKALDREMKILGTAKPTEFKFTFDINLVMQLVEVIEAHGDNASDWFLACLQEYASADDGEVQAAQEILHAYKHTD